MPTRSKWPAILMTTFAAFGGILYGYDTGTISGIIAMKYYQFQFGHRTDGQTGLPFDPHSSYALNTADKSLVVSILSAGTFLGALFAAPMGDLVGRKLGLIFSCLIFCVGVALQTAATAVTAFAVGRVLAGFGVGLISCLVPMYQSECAPKWLRGAIVSCYQWAITIGLLIASIADDGTSSHNSSSAYRIPIGIQFVWAAVLAGGMTFLPESPRYYIRRGRQADAARSLARLNSGTVDDSETVAQLAEIKANFEYELSFGKVGYAECFIQGKKKHLLRTLTGITLQAFQQLSGINFIFYYGTTFFQRSGIAKPFTISIITNVVNVVSTVPGMWAVEKIGRRKLLLIGAAGMCFCEFIIAIVGVTISVSNTAGQKVLIAFVCFYIFFFASTWGPIAWVVTGEIYPLATRAKAMSMSTASNWLWNFAIGYSTPYLVDPGRGNANLGAKVFFIWGTACFGAFIFTYFCIAETKGLSLEEVDELYQTTIPSKSSSFRPSVRFVDEVHRPGSTDKTAAEKLAV
ncbi:putative glucose transporter rco-3 [Neolecta irregularis DAH-3]|uniref:Putative glucose transporter rco-3 n=1 Tax=Neolecta irregularis (strain DAH-3) TaxID=1198029 RepID=A0A1U7LVY2_NEOID|nr:putative glucose transporter rco-3 [Neolecta irregularis DAH-3]|eukprot:OLL26835.1 putative glucose transporter rco-3 [Neolecta irregularis DAH-3]